MCCALDSRPEEPRHAPAGDPASCPAGGLSGTERPSLPRVWQPPHPVPASGPQTGARHPPDDGDCPPLPVSVLVAPGELGQHPIEKHAVVSEHTDILMD